MHRNRFNKLMLKKNSFEPYFLLEKVLNKVLLIRKPLLTGLQITSLRDLLAHILLRMKIDGSAPHQNFKMFRMEESSLKRSHKTVRDKLY